MKNYFKPLALIVTMIAFTACSSDDDTPEVINEEEVINEVVLEVTESGTANTVEYTWIEGSGAPEQIVIDAGKDYEVSVSFFNSTDPANVEDITEEVIMEADEHQVFYEFTGDMLSITPSENDNVDSQSNPLGINTIWSASGSTSTTVTVYLIHEPVTKTGATRDDFGGETDVQVNFTVAVN